MVQAVLPLHWGLWDFVSRVHDPFPDLVANPETDLLFTGDGEAFNVRNSSKYQRNYPLTYAIRSGNS